jgi:hypothetical protein
MSNLNETAEQKRLNEAREQKVPWKKWGPYLSERQWGTVREDYSDNGDAWSRLISRILSISDSHASETKVSAG